MNPLDYKTNIQEWPWPHQQGWQCPICHRCYSPTTGMCYYCGHGTVTTTGTSTEIPPLGKEKITKP